MPTTCSRCFDGWQPNRAWVDDITYIATGEGWLYLAVVTYLASRRIVGWSMSDAIDAKLVCAALRSAYWQRKPSPGVLVHTDRGSQGVFNRSTQHLNHGGVYGTTRGVDAEVDGPRSNALAKCAVASSLTRAGVGEMPLR